MNCCEQMNHDCRQGRDCPLQRERADALMNNIRRYPRSLADAFPAERASAIERHTTRRTGLTKYAAWVAFGLFCLLFISARNS